MDERKLGIKRIKNDDERKEVIDELNANINELDWLTNSSDIYADINAELDKITSKGAEMSEEDKDKAAILRRKFIAIKEGTYQPMLKRNIASLLVSLEYDDAKKEDRTPFDILKGIITGDEAIKANLSKKYTFFLANFTGEIPGTADINLESIDEILEYIGTHCDLVALDPKSEVEKKKKQEISETGLVPSSELPKEGLLNRVLNNVVEPYLAEHATKKGEGIATEKTNLADKSIETTKDIKAPPTQEKSRKANNELSHGKPEKSGKEID